jgi:hypothetical protein
MMRLPYKRISVTQGREVGLKTEITIKLQSFPKMVRNPLPSNLLDIFQNLSNAFALNFASQVIMTWKKVLTLAM